MVYAHKDRRKRGDVHDSNHRTVEQVAEVDGNEEASGSESLQASQKNKSDGRISNANQKTKGDEASKSGLDLEDSIDSDMSEMDVIAKQDNVF